MTRSSSNHAINCTCTQRAPADLLKGTQSQAQVPPQGAVLSSTAAVSSTGLPSETLLINTRAASKSFVLWNRICSIARPCAAAAAQEDETLEMQAPAARHRHTWRPWLVAVVLAVQPSVLETLAQERHAATHMPAFAGHPALCVERSRRAGYGTGGLQMVRDRPPAPPGGDASKLASRRFVVQTAAGGAAALALDRLPFLRTLPASAAEAPSPGATAAPGAAVAPGRVYDLSLDKIYNRAPGKLVVLPPDAVQKSPADSKTYRAMTLPNGLRVLLTSDPAADAAAAALNVHVGHFSDPEAIPGLAHFCEHMLFLGTAKYPREGELETYLSRNAGRSNAFTGNEETCYYFSVNQDALKGALDIFASFFVAPLFAAAGVEREINAVNSENAKNLNTDSWRIGVCICLTQAHTHVHKCLYTCMHTHVDICGG